MLNFFRNLCGKKPKNSDSLLNPSTHTSEEKNEANSKNENNSHSHESYSSSSSYQNSEENTESYNNNSESKINNKEPTRCSKAKHMGEPLISSFGKMAAGAELFLLCDKSALIGGGIGVVLAICNGVVQYHYITLPAAKGEQKLDTTISNQESSSCNKLGVPLIIALSSAGESTSSYVKTFLKTGGNIYLAVGAAYLDFLTYTHANGQALYSNKSGGNIKDCWLGKVTQFMTLDYEIIRKNILDVKSLATQSYPFYQGLVQMLATFTLGSAFGIGLPFTLPLALFTAYSQYNIHKGYGQQVMSHTFDVLQRKQEHQYLAWLIDRTVSLAYGFADRLINLVPDALSILLPNKAVMHTSNVLAGLVSGAELGKKVVTINFLKKIPTEALEAMGALGMIWATTSTYFAAQKQTINEEEIGVNQLVETRLGKQQEQGTCGERTKLTAISCCRYTFLPCPKTGEDNTRNNSANSSNATYEAYGKEDNDTDLTKLTVVNTNSPTISHSSSSSSSSLSASYTLTHSS